MSTISIALIFVTVALFLCGITMLFIVVQKRQLAKQLSQQEQQTQYFKRLNSNAEAAKSAAEAANLAKNKYLSGISHELRTPLNVIMGYAQLLENCAEAADPNLTKYQLIKKNCEHLTHLIEGILEFSAIESGKLKVQSDVVDLSQLLAQISQMFASQASQKNLTFKADISKNLPQFVKTDPKRLKQILFNLLSNAVKFTQQGQIKFSVHYRNQIATFVVHDSGCGIEAEHIDRIFQPFERVEQNHNHVPGTGLGLTIANLLTELLGGELTVTSQVGQGTEFTLKLMLSAQVFQKSFDTINLKTDQQKHRLLLVDDVAEHRDLMTNILSPYGFAIDQAANTKEAKTLIKKHSFDLAFFDIAMPDENGWQLAAWCRKQQLNFKIVMVSANPRDNDPQRHPNHQAYLAKPIQINQLLATINHLLNLGWEISTTAEPIINHKVIKLSRNDRMALKQLIEIGHINGIENYLHTMHDKQLISRDEHKQLLDPVQQLNLKQFSHMAGIDD